MSETKTTKTKVTVKKATTVKPATAKTVVKKSTSTNTTVKNVEVVCVGFGQAGSRMAIANYNELKHYGRAKIIIANISDKELDTLPKEVSMDNRIHIGGGDFKGGGGLRSKTYEEIASVYYKDVVERIIGLSKGAKFIYVYGASTGATAASFVPIVAASLNTKNSIDKIGNPDVLSFGILTDVQSTEGRSQHQNCIETLDQVNKLAEYGRYMIVNQSYNPQVVDVEGNDVTLSPNERLNLINKTIAERLYRYMTEVGVAENKTVLDVADRMKALRLTGIHAIVDPSSSEHIFHVPAGSDCRFVQGESCVNEEQLDDFIERNGISVSFGTKEGFFTQDDENTQTPIIHTAGAFNVSVLVEQFKESRNRIIQRSESIVKKDVHGSGFNGLSKEKEIMNSKLSGAGLSSSDDLMNLL